jgi:predicted transcriptional regulator
MKPFCEVVVSDVLPAIRALIAKNLLEQGLTQKQISEKLGITQPAVSQYLKEIRGNMRVIKNKKILEEIKKFSAEIAGGNLSGVQIHQRFCDICLNMRERRIMCKLHDGSVIGCKICRG